MVVRSTIMHVNHLNIFLLNVWSDCSIAIVIRGTFYPDHHHIGRAVPVSIVVISSSITVLLALFSISLRILVWLYHFFYFNYVVSCVPCGSLAIILSFSYKLINFGVRAHPEGIDPAKVRVSEVSYSTLVWLEKDSLLAVRWSRYDCLSWVNLRFKARNSLSLIVFTSIVFLWRCWIFVDYRSLLLRCTRGADYLW